ncbi:hypothetical protein JKF63_01459 [Porcisia hertigi]|uniref:Uncharacterized protein n=1 Tax=Porcisia hertigi TaxID=2761500 RepID=A0A836HJT1_9TRYP|nr:hypothetical protein JKF63_01459 [Porcisia hertigi]
MSIGAFDDQQKGYIAHLQDVLHKREYHLAELINEVVYAEEERYKALQEANSLRELSTRLEDVVNKLLEYNIIIHKEVILPVLIDTNGASGLTRSAGASSEENSTTARSLTNVLDGLLDEPHLSSETKRLLRGVLQKQQKNDLRLGGSSGPHSNSLTPSAALLHSAPHEPPALEEASVHKATRQAILLTSSLLQNQETLAQLLHGIQTQAKDLLHRSNVLGTMEVQDRPQTVSESDAQQQKRTRTIAPFRLEKQRNAEFGRDAPRGPLCERDPAAGGAAAAVSPAAAAQADESWLQEREQLKRELAYTQQRVLQEQALSRELKRQVSQLEVGAAAPTVPSAASSSTCPHCEKMRLEMAKNLSYYQATKTAWKTEKQHLRNDIASLRLQVKETANDASPSAEPPSAGALTSGPQCYTKEAASNRKIGQLEATVSALKADLHIMEMRMSIMLDERDAERRRILAAHEQERQRLRDEKDKCQRIINSMSRELQGLSQISSGTHPAITSIAG